MSLILETLVNLWTDLQIETGETKLIETENLLRIQEHLKLCLGNSNLIANTCVDHECQMIVNWQRR